MKSFEMGGQTVPVFERIDLESPAYLQIAGALLAQEAMFARTLAPDEHETYWKLPEKERVYVASNQICTTAITNSKRAKTPEQVASIEERRDARIAHLRGQHITKTLLRHAIIPNNDPARKVILPLEDEMNRRMDTEVYRSLGTFVCHGRTDRSFPELDMLSDTQPTAICQVNNYIISRLPYYEVARSDGLVHAPGYAVYVAEAISPDTYIATEEDRAQVGG